MITLRELFEVFWTITRVEVTARKHDMNYIHRWIYGEDINISSHMLYDCKDGLLSIIDKKINYHGDDGRGGPEMGWGVKEKLFPKELLDARITHMSVVNHHSGEHTLYVDIVMHELTAMSLIEGGTQ